MNTCFESGKVYITDRIGLAIARLTQSEQKTLSNERISNNRLLTTVGVTSKMMKNNKLSRIREQVLVLSGPSIPKFVLDLL